MSLSALLRAFRGIPFPEGRGAFISRRETKCFAESTLSL
jgi:hypothetical protein